MIGPRWTRKQLYHSINSAGELMNGADCNPAIAQQGSNKNTAQDAPEVNPEQSAPDRSPAVDPAVKVTPQVAVSTVEELLKKFTKKLAEKREKLPTTEMIYEIYKDIVEDLGDNSLTMNHRGEARAIISVMEHVSATLNHTAMSALISHIPALAASGIKPFDKMKSMMLMLRQVIHSNSVWQPCQAKITGKRRLCRVTCMY